MMCSNKYNSKTAPEMLQLNLEIISKELTELIVTGDQELGISRQFSVSAIQKTAQSLVSVPALASNFHAPRYINPFCGQQHLCVARGISSFEYNASNNRMIQQPLAFPNHQNGIESANNSTPAANLNAGKYLSPLSVSSVQSPYQNENAKPTFEFHYLRTRAENERRTPGPLPTSVSVGQGAYRKTNKQTQKHFYHKMQHISGNNEEIQFDLSAIEFLNDKQNSIVRRLFDLLHDLHLAVAEKPPSFENNSDSQYEETFVTSITSDSTMPSTLNVQNQVKQACRKLTIFTHEMQRKLNVNKAYESEMPAECEFHLNVLRQYLNELEMYKRIVMEHKHGKFLREEVNVHAERLSLVLEHTNRQIREVHIRVLATDWYIGVKYRGDIHLAAIQLNTEVSNKSKIGAINEILQMCNTTETTAIKYNTTEAAKPEIVNNSATNLIYNQEAVNVQPLFSTNNDIFNIYKPTQTKRSAATASGGHPHYRNPVFYIG